MPFAWYLSVDMQLFVIAPLIAYLLYRFKLKFVVVVILATFASMGRTFYAFMLYGDAATR